VVITGFGVAAGADIAPIMTAEEMPRKSAENCEEKSESQASGIDNHRRLFQFMLLIVAPVSNTFQAINPPPARGLSSPQQYPTEVRSASLAS
jgi:hypothetical protein